MLDLVTKEVQIVLGLDDSPNPDVRFFDLRMDSLMAVELRNRLQRQFPDLDLASTIAFDYPTTRQLSAYISLECEKSGLYNGDCSSTCQTQVGSGISSELLRIVSDEVKSVLRLDDCPDPKKRFFDLRMDSLMAVELRNRLQNKLPQLDLASTIAFDYPTVQNLAEYLTAEIQRSSPDQNGTPKESEPQVTGQDLRTRLHQLIDELPEEELLKLMQGL